MHPNTIQIFDYGHTPEGIFYYAMEYLDGLNLAEFVEAYGPQPEGRVINLLIQVCESLAEAHAGGLVHRDIKPANVFVTDRGGVPDMVKVLDFGLVRPVASTDDTVLDADDTEILVGTPSYMSPEAVETSANTDARSDLYSVGAVGYYLLTGQGPFDGETIGRDLPETAGGKARAAIHQNRPAHLPAPRSLDLALPGARPEGPPAIRPRADDAIGGQPAHRGLERRTTGRLVGGPSRSHQPGPGRRAAAHRDRQGREYRNRRPHALAPFTFHASRFTYFTSRMSSVPAFASKNGLPLRTPTVP